LIAAGLALVALALGVAILATALATPVLAASPSPAPSPVIGVPSDPRGGAGPPLVGSPGLALLVVLGAGMAVAVVTLVAARLIARPKRARRR
jgi:hypothetical protein